MLLTVPKDRSMVSCFRHLRSERLGQIWNSDVEDVTGAEDGLRETGERGADEAESSRAKELLDETEEVVAELRLGHARVEVFKPRLELRVKLEVCCEREFGKAVLERAEVVGGAATIRGNIDGNVCLEASFVAGVGKVATVAAKAHGKVALITKADVHGVEGKVVTHDCLGHRQTEALEVRREANFALIVLREPVAVVKGAPEDHDLLVYVFGRLEDVRGVHLAARA
mmetsp:Transcript_8192/g.26023  ORF Transcript_8192/g.26023 Transcript_8192/m.26023 type:complete len:227 (+) Transcript_8192:228-908(+)